MSAATGTFRNIRLVRVMLCAVLLSVLIVCLYSRASYAANWNIHVKNSNGVAQAATYVLDQDGNRIGRADGYGNWAGTVYDSIIPHVTRYPIPQSTYGLSAPEGFPGVSADSVAADSDGSVTLVVPSTEYVAANPELSSPERWIVGRINEIRADHNLPALPISNTLSRAADGYSNFLTMHNYVMKNEDKSGHIQNSLPYIRANDQGWPGDGGVGENGASSSSASGALTSWINSPGHFANIINTYDDEIGIGIVGSMYFLNFGDCPEAASERCENTGDYGDPNADNGDGGTTELNPNIVVKTKKLSRRKVRTTITVKSGEGLVRYSARTGRSKARASRNLKTNATGVKTYTFTSILRKKSRWTITVRFNGSGDWTDRTIKKAVRIH